MMHQKLDRLVYVSKNRLPPPTIRHEIEAILEVSRRKNAKLGVTGALMFNGGVFAQVLEGPYEHVASVFESIQQDERHGDVQVLGFGPVAKRAFPSWSMAHLGRSRQGEQMFGHIGDATGFDDSRFDGDRVLEILRTIALEEEMCVA